MTTGRILAWTTTTVTCEATITTTALLEFLTPRQVTVAGLLADNKSVGQVLLHAGGDGYHVLAEQAEQAIFTTADGNQVSIPCGHPDFDHAITSAGTRDHLQSVTLRTTALQPHFHQRTFNSLPLDVVGWLQVTGRHICYNPYTTHALLCERGTDPLPPALPSLLHQHFLTPQRLHKLGQLVATKVPWLIPRCMDLAHHGLSKGCATDTIASTSCQEYEVAVPVAQTTYALSQVQQLSLAWRDDQRYYLPAGITLRYHPPNNYPLSIAYQAAVVSFTFSLQDSAVAGEFAAAVQEALGTRFAVGKYYPTVLTDHAGWSEFHAVTLV